MTVLAEKKVFLNGCEALNNIRVGYRSYANRTLIRSNVTIGRYCSIGRRCTIGGPDHPTHWLSSHPFMYSKAENPDAVSFLPRRSIETKLGNDIWIGDNALIMYGITIGDGAVIAGGAVVTKDVEPYTIVTGAPARPLRLRFDKAIADRLLSLRWWDYGDAILSKLPYDDPQRCADELELRVSSGAFPILEPHHAPIPRS